MWTGPVRLLRAPRGVMNGKPLYRDKLILYGCGDFLSDYEGIRGHEQYRGDLPLMYFPYLEAATGRQALQVIERHNAPIHLLLTDAVMPEMGLSKFCSSPPLGTFSSV